MRQYYYIAPHIFPIFPARIGNSVVGIDFQSLMLDAASKLSDADIILTIETYMEGERQSEETLVLEVRDEVVSPRFFNRTFTLPECGYVVFSLTAETPYFRKLKPELGYGLFARQDGGTSTIISQPKYAVPMVIDNMRETGTFCLVHQAQYINREKNIGNSVFFINPYDGKIVTRIKTARGREMKQRLESCSAMLVSLDPVLEDGVAECVMYTGNNRMIGWDVRHKFDDQDTIYNVDHLEYFRADKTVEHRSFMNQVKKFVRRTLRNSGVWF